VCGPALAATDVTLLHFSDYHSHALPFYSEGREEQGGIARAVGYLRRAHDRGAVVLSGGDMINKGSPAWSDKYRCVEWPWLNGIVDAMAYGNHDADYGSEVFRRCVGSIAYPILSANLSGPPLTAVRPYVVLRRLGIRIGVFAVGGPDFETLVKPEARPVAGARFGDAVAAARTIVQRLREDEHVDTVVMIGHEHRDDDFALAREVAGIDVIFGTHSHRKDDLQQIHGTGTWFISPFQYLAYVSRVVMTFEDHRLIRVAGGLVRMDDSIPPDKTIAGRVKRLRRKLERDPAYAELFRPIGTASRAIDVPELGDMVADLMRKAANADVALSTASSFRQAIPRGPITMEVLRSALPYDNEIVVAELSGSQLQKLLEVAHGGADGGAYISGEAMPEAGKRYRVAATDYLARVASGYRDAFAGAAIQRTGLRVRDELRKSLTGPRTTPVIDLDLPAILDMIASRWSLAPPHARMLHPRSTIQAQEVVSP
jgi:5'-nucleotidase